MDGMTLSLDETVLGVARMLNDADMNEEGVSLGSRAGVWCGVVSRDGLSSPSGSMVTMFVTVHD